MQSGEMLFSEVSEHKLLTEFYLEGELEISDDWVKSSGVFFSEAVFCGREILAAYSLSRRYGVTVLDYIAVKKHNRKSGIGSIVLNRIKEKCMCLGADKIYLTAKARDFFLKNGAEEISCGSPLYIDLLGECAECPQRGKDCFPSVMVIKIRK